MIFQQFNLLDAKTVFENVAFPLEVSGYPEKQIKDRVGEILELVGLTEDAPYANDLYVRQGEENRPEIKKLAEVLTSPDVKKFIQDKYGVAVVPAFLKYMPQN